MKRTWQIVSKDLWRLRWAIVAWCLVIAAKLGIGAFLAWSPLIATASAIWEPWLKAGSALAGLEALTGFLLVAGLVQSDVLVGTTAHWMTRPISRGRLLGAKLLGLGVIFGLLPLVITLPWWLACGYGMNDLWPAMVETLSWQLLVVLVALPMAVLTDGFGRFLLWSLVLGAAIGCLVLSRLVTSPDPGPPSLVANLGIRRGLAGLLIFLGACSVATVVRYFQRRTGLAEACLVGGLVLAGLAFRSWPWVGPPPGERPLASAGLASAIVVSSGPGVVLGDGPNGTKRIRVDFGIENVPPGFLISRGSLGEVRNRWTWSEGVELEKFSSLSPWEAASGLGQILSPAWARLGIKYPVPVSQETNPRYPTDEAIQSPGPHFSRFAELFVPASLAVKMTREPSIYRADITFVLMRLQAAGEVPVERGQVLRRGREWERIVEVRRNLGTSQSTRRTMTRRTALGPDPLKREEVVIHSVDVRRLSFFSSGLVLGIFAPFRTEANYVLLDATHTVEQTANSSYPAVSARVATVGIARRVTTFNLPASVGTQANSLEGKTLAKVLDERVEPFSRKIEVKDFTVETAGRKEAP